MQKRAWNQAKQAFLTESNSLVSALDQSALDQIDKKVFALAVDALKNAGRIASSGCGHSGIARRRLNSYTLS